MFAVKAFLPSGAAGRSSRSLGQFSAAVRGVEGDLFRRGAGVSGDLLD